MIRINGVPFEMISPKKDLYLGKRINFGTGEGIYHVFKTPPKQLGIGDKLKHMRDELNAVQDSISSRIFTVYKNMPKHSPEEYYFLKNIYDKLNVML